MAAPKTPDGALRCGQCGERKPLTEFNRARTKSTQVTFSRQGRDGYYRDCKVCVRAYQKRIADGSPKTVEARKKATSAWHKRVKAKANATDQILRMVLLCKVCAGVGAVQNFEGKVIMCRCRDDLVTFCKNFAPSILREHIDLRKGKK